MSAAEDYSDDDLPRPFGGYLLLQNFARGGMGEVYLAKTTTTPVPRTCVVKKLRSELTRDREYVTRFIDEARVVVTLNHVNICNVFDVGRVTHDSGAFDEYYLAMEYVSGRDVRTLQDRCIRDGVAPTVATALHLACETAQALDYAHRRKHPVSGEPLNLVHRDVSPQNVLVSFDGAVKLIDFGLAASRLKVERTQPNVVMGKMAYMAPEQARGDAIDSRADLFACGVLAYELVANERFYEGMTANDIWQVAGRGGFLPRGLARFDAGLASIIGRALAPDPKRRFATCGEFREALLAHARERWPENTGAQGLRELMGRLFVDEIAKERQVLESFGTLDISRFRDELESSHSHSVTLATHDEAGARIVRDERTNRSPAPVSFAPRSTDEGTPVASERPGDTLHDDETALAAVRPSLASAPTASGSESRPRVRIHDEQTMVTNPSQRPLLREATAVVARRRPLPDTDEMSTPGDVTTLDLPRRRVMWIAGGVIVALVCLGVIALVVMTPAPAHAPVPTTTVGSLPSVTTTTTNPEPTPTTPTMEVPLEALPTRTARVEPTTTPKEAPPKETPPKDATPKERPPKEKPEVKADVVVDKAFWEALLRKHTRAPCVMQLTKESFALTNAFLPKRRDAIRECATSVGFKPR